MELEKVTETKHDELLALLNPLVDFMQTNGFSYFLVAGKDSTCTRHLMGTPEDIIGMIESFCKDNNQVNALIGFTKDNQVD